MSTENLAILGALTGIVGGLTGVASLIWQISAHRLSGRLVSVVSRYIFPVYGSLHSPEFRDDNQVAIKISNRGGAPVTVLNCGVRLGRTGKGTNMFVLDHHALATSLPAVVEPGGEPAQIMVPVKQLRQAAQEQGVAFRKMRPWVDLGDGRRIYSKTTVPLK